MYEYDIRVGYSQVDENKKLTIPALIDIFQDCSTFQSEDLGIGFDYCREHGYFWVINSWQVEIDRLPELCENVSVFTYPVEFKGFMGKRCFGLKSGDDIIVRCFSLWALLSTKTSKPVPMDALMNERYKTEEALPMGRIVRKITVPEESRKMAPLTIEPIHLDANHHVNNGKYVAIAAAYLPENFPIKGFRAQYISQAFLGDVIYPRVAGSPGEGCIISLENGDGAPYAVMEFK